LLAQDTEHEQTVGAQVVLFSRQNPELDRHTVCLQARGNPSGFGKGKDLVVLAVDKQQSG